MYTVFKPLDKIATGLHSDYIWITTPFYLLFTSATSLYSCRQDSNWSIFGLYLFTSATSLYSSVNLATSLYYSDLRDILFTSALFKKLFQVYSRGFKLLNLSANLFYRPRRRSLLCKISSHVRRIILPYEFWNRTGPWNTITGLWIDTRRRHWNFFTD